MHSVFWFSGMNSWFLKVLVYVVSQLKVLILVKSYILSSLCLIWKPIDILSWLEWCSGFDSSCKWLWRDRSDNNNRYSAPSKGGRCHCFSWKICANYSSPRHKNCCWQVNWQCCWVNIRFDNFAGETICLTNKNYQLALHSFLRMCQDLEVLYMIWISQNNTKLFSGQKSKWLV